MTDPWSPHLADGVPFDADDPPGPSLPARWAARWAAQPGRPVLRGRWPGFDPGDTGGWVTAGRLDQASRRAAAVLAAAGLGPGDRLVWSTATGLASVVALVGALRLGAVGVPVNAAYTQRELAHVVADVRPALVVVDRPDQAAWVAGVDPGVPVWRPDLVPVDGSAPGRSGTAPGLDTARPEDPALIVYTSGTTGAPKGAVLSHANLAAGSRALELAWRWTPEDRLVLALPLFHVHGLCVGLFGTLAAGASAVVLERFDAPAVLEAVRDDRATMFFGVPTMYHRLAGADGADGLARLRLCVSGSAPLPAARWHEMKRRAGVEVLERYGMTETLLTVSNPYVGERRPGTVGFPLPGVSTRLERVDAGDPEAGRLMVRGPSVFSGYWERPAATAEAFADDWFRTGDLAGLDPDGYLAIKGRSNDLIISGGFNVYPAEIEDVLLAHPAVAEAAVTGVASEEWGETVTAWVVPADGPIDTDELLAHAAARLAPYKRPRLVRVVDALPRNAMGKVLRAELR
jgi:malonyl-CoA/methylmalonyl-CoA synthetase